MRLDKFVSDAAALTRSEARKAIKYGRIFVGETAVRDIAFQIDENAQVYLDGKEISYKKYVYIMLNKPQGYVSATEDKRQKTVLNLIDPSYARYQLFPVGRLDIDTEGFLLLTNDGDMAHNLLAPNKKVGKTYFLTLEHNISDEEIKKLEEGVDIGDCITKEAKAKRVAENEIELTITEGKFHQIKRMAKAVGNSVVYLKRLSYGDLFLDTLLKTGGYRELLEKEVQKLYNFYKKND